MRGPRVPCTCRTRETLPWQEPKLDGWKVRSYRSWQTSCTPERLLELVAWEEQDFELLTERLVQLEGHLVALACCASPRSHVHGKRRLPRDRLHVELATVDQLLGPEVKDGHDGAVIEVAIEGLGRCASESEACGSRRKLLGNC